MGQFNLRDKVYEMISNDVRVMTNIAEALKYDKIIIDQKEEQVAELKATIEEACEKFEFVLEKTDYGVRLFKSREELEHKRAKEREGMQ
ncbi:hypothetical protein A374_08789 [Fictibacillus macauensis ZFHKF-1]|uniref:Uncharacterized protein n=1 Tax=Fictibacillus macauensis ZFHKF-1 TaxID=1196324 RepID=I8AK38_9BACL|nr:hypothetical protein [Fictibacillus macauensis]EIT85919.1 hypothetical protein A374_08789 [Fictibacillus macauensis ZFHKF-1]